MTHHYGIDTDVVIVDICGYEIKKNVFLTRSPSSSSSSLASFGSSSGLKSSISTWQNTHTDAHAHIHAHTSWFRSHDSDTVWAAVCRTPDLLYSSVLEQGPDIQAHHVTRRRLPVAGHLWMEKVPFMKIINNYWTTADTNTHENLKHSTCGDNTEKANNPAFDHFAYYVTELLWIQCTCFDLPQEGPTRILLFVISHSLNSRFNEMIWKKRKEGKSSQTFMMSFSLRLWTFLFAHVWVSAVISAT